MLIIKAWYKYLCNNRYIYIKNPYNVTFIPFLMTIYLLLTIICIIYIIICIYNIYYMYFTLLIIMYQTNSSY